MKKIVIFDLDGTLALIDKRRALATKDNGKMDWDVFFNPDNIDLDIPNDVVVSMVDMLKMRPQDKLYMKDSILKEQWLYNLDFSVDDIFAVFDDRNQVVDMWRDNGLTTFQVADGDF